MSPKRDSILHVLSLDTIGGVELSFASFLRDPNIKQRLSNHVMVWNRPVHPLIRGGIHREADTIHHLRYIKGIKIPRWPKALRQDRLARTIRTLAPQRIILWNGFGNSALARLCGEVAQQVLYYERGAGWGNHNAGDGRAFLAEINGVICNSSAAKRILHGRFGWDGKTAICPNPVRENCVPLQPTRKVLPSNRPVRLGIAGRLIPVKGHVIALHALRSLLDRGIEVELHIAGRGPEEQKLRSLASNLGLGQQVKFLGLVDDMPEFYRSIDLLAVPSLREPFGNVSVEAAAWGCPVIASAVDGLPETMLPGETGILLPCTESLETYRKLGGGLQGLPEFVFDVPTAQLATPRALQPKALAKAVEDLCQSPQRYEAISRAAGAHAFAHQTQDAFIKNMLSGLDAFGPVVQRSQLPGKPLLGAFRSSTGV